MADNTHPITVKSVPGILAIGLMIMVAATTAGIFIIEVPSSNQTVIIQIVTTELTLLGMAIAFFYGSSSSSRDTQKTLANLAESNLAAQTTLSAATPSGGRDSMALKQGEIAVAVASPGGGAEITKSPEVLDSVLENLDKTDPTFRIDPSTTGDK